MRVLVAPLNWGLGHATRCMPIIRELQAQGAEVWLASDGVAFELLKKEFPELPLLELPGYRITYPTANFVYNMTRHSLNIIRAMRKEHRVLRRWVKEHAFGAVISDNRLGMWHEDIPSVIISHQLQLLSPSKLLQPLVDGLYFPVLRRYDEIWVPDVATAPNLTGPMSHGTVFSPKYIGIVSRMCADLDVSDTPAHEVVVLLSGPEPQRTYLEEKLLSQALALPDKRFLFVRGLPGQAKPLPGGPNIEVVDFLRGDELNRVLLRAGMIVCRSGYSTVMDLAAIGKKAIFIPTPGQTEQLFLAELLDRQRAFFCCQQDSIQLAPALESAQRYSGMYLPPQPERLRAVIGELLNRIP
jgi:UDP:flavonoid glycosyltransferase YjiC (YdhE family)